jgi:hypothetical protein
MTGYLTLASRALGGFADFAYNPLQPILERSFGPDIDMKQTGDLWR